MKAVLEFDLPEDDPYFQDAIKAKEYRFALSEFREFLRRKIKYDENMSEEESKIYEAVREYFHECIAECGDV